MVIILFFIQSKILYYIETLIIHYIEIGICIYSLTIQCHGLPLYECLGFCSVNIILLN